MDRHYVAVCSFFLMACAQNPDAGQHGGAQSSYSEPTCTRGPVDRISSNEPTEAGTAIELAAAVEGEQRAPLLWSVQRMTGVRDPAAFTEVVARLSVDVNTARTVAQVATRSANARYCGTLLELDGTLSFETTDGAFGDQFSGIVQRDPVAGTVHFDAKLGADRHQGSYPLNQEPGAFVEVSTNILPDLRGSLFERGAVSPSNPVGSLFVATWPSTGPEGHAGGDGG